MSVHITASSVRVDPVADIPGDASVPALVRARAEARPHEPIAEWVKGGVWHTITAAEFADAFFALAEATIEWGIHEGERVAVLGRSGLTWNLIDLALQTIGAIVVPIYETSSIHQIRAICTHSGIRRAFVDDAHREALAALGVECKTFADALAHTGLTGAATASGRERALERLRERRLDEVATIVYSSGTTGRPRAVPLTHRNIAGMLIQQQIFFPQAIHDADVRCMLFLPMAHVFARTAAYMPLAGEGVCAHVTPEAGSLTDNIASFRPTTIGAVPRVLEKIEEASRARARGPIARAVYDWAGRVSRARAPYVRHNRSVPACLRVRYALARVLVLGKITAALGGQLRCVVSGGAPLDPDLDDLFTGMGIRICNGYGLTESTGGFFCNTFTHARAGTAGRPLPGCEARITDENELEIRGIGVFGGYEGDDEATRAAFTPDGWFRTGDLGVIDRDGYVRITGRKNDTIITAGGKNVHPEPLEEAIRRNPLVEQVIVIGERRNFVAALVTLVEGVEREGPQVISSITESIREANARVSRAESIRRFTILDQHFSEDDGTLTPSLKLKRKAIEQAYADVIDGLYASREGHDVTPPSPGEKETEDGPR